MRSAPTPLWYSLRAFAFRLGQAQSEPIQIQANRIYLLPTGAGVFFACTLLAMLLGSINYALSLGLVLSFSLGGIALAGAMQGFRNLLKIEITQGKTSPVFCGDPTNFVLIVANPSNRVRLSLECVCEGSSSRLEKLPPHSQGPLNIKLATHRRGYLDLPWITLQTRYPLGLVAVWSYVRPPARVLVWPKPETKPPPLPHSPGSEGHHALSAISGVEDFSNLRGYQPTDSPKHIAWKVLAREGPLLVKNFSSPRAGRVILDWAALGPELTTEHKLSRLTAWVCQAHQSGASWQLCLPDLTIGPDQGEAHLQACLRALALHGHPRA
jgi:uncharacterized protein (DUF58 family)